jgi:arylsulfatase A-like enzyme
LSQTCCSAIVGVSCEDAPLAFYRLIDAAPVLRLCRPDHFGTLLATPIRIRRVTMSARWLMVLCIASSCCWQATPGWAQEKAAGRPNIVLIVGDDLGYGELGCYGGKEIPTPHLDGLARNGVRCTNGYVSCPVCSPTRAGLMTGRYQQRFGHEFNPGPANQAADVFGLPLTEVTLPDRLKAAGYVTGMVGKWHLGYKPEYQPQKRGFDEFFGFLGGAHSYVDAKEDKANAILRGTEPVDEKEYLTDAFTREAVAFIDRHQKEPFFLYLPYNAVHAPMQAPEKYKTRVAGIKDDKRRTFAAMLTALDDGVGAVLKKLQDAGVSGNTLVIFITDNGGPTPQITSKNDPLSGRKGQVMEGGIRVPFILHWPGKLPAGRVYEQPVIALDILPTAVAAAGAVLPENAKLDGANLLPHLTGKLDTPPHDSLHWRFGNQWALRKGNLKLAKLANGEPKLFDLADDIGETKDLATAKPELLKELLAEHEKWNAELMKPRWGQPRQ